MAVHALRYVGWTGRLWVDTMGLEEGTELR
jgi:hypothetical protein